MKTEITKLIEKRLCERANRNCERFALEVAVKGGICDFVTVNFDFKNHNLPYITCYEIKVSYNDYKSKHGHNFVGDENYYVVPLELYKDKIENKEHLGGIGLIAYSNSGFYKKVESVAVYRPSTLDDKMQIVDTILMRWSSGGMYANMNSLKCDLRNWQNGERVRGNR